MKSLLEMIRETNELESPEDKAEMIARLGLIRAHIYQGWLPHDPNSNRMKIDSMVREAVIRLVEEARKSLRKEIEDTERKG